MLSFRRARWVGFLTGSALIGMFSFSSGLRAQGSQSGQLAGAVLDSEGSPIAGVAVKVTSPALQGERSGHTGMNGNYIIRGLPPGEYEVVFQLEGMTTVNDQTKIAWDTTVFPDFSGPVDQHGIWTDYVRGPNFGEARSPEDFVTAREFLVSVGVRF